MGSSLLGVNKKNYEQPIITSRISRPTLEGAPANSRLIRAQAGRDVEDASAISLFSVHLRVERASIARCSCFRLPSGAVGWLPGRLHPGVGAGADLSTDSGSQPSVLVVDPVAARGVRVGMRLSSSPGQGRRIARPSPVSALFAQPPHCHLHITTALSFLSIAFLSFSFSFPFPPSLSTC